MQAYKVQLPSMYEPDFEFCVQICGCMRRQNGVHTHFSVCLSISCIPYCTRRNILFHILVIRVQNIFGFEPNRFCITQCDTLSCQWWMSSSSKISFQLNHIQALKFSKHTLIHTYIHALAQTMPKNGEANKIWLWIKHIDVITTVGFCNQFRQRPHSQNNVLMQSHVNTY